MGSHIGRLRAVIGFGAVDAPAVRIPVVIQHADAERSLSVKALHGRLIEVKLSEGTDAVVPGVAIAVKTVIPGMFVLSVKTGKPRLKEHTRQETNRAQLAVTGEAHHGISARHVKVRARLVG